MEPCRYRFSCGHTCYLPWRCEYPSDLTCDLAPYRSKHANGAIVINGTPGYLPKHTATEAAIDVQP